MPTLTLCLLWIVLGGTGSIISGLGFPILSIGDTKLENERGLNEPSLLPANLQDIIKTEMNTMLETAYGETRDLFANRNGNINDIDIREFPQNYYAEIKENPIPTHILFAVILLLLVISGVIGAMLMEFCPGSCRGMCCKGSTEIVLLITSEGKHREFSDMKKFPIVPSGEQGQGSSCRCLNKEAQCVTVTSTKSPSTTVKIFINKDENENDVVLLQA